MACGAWSRADLPQSSCVGREAQAGARHPRETRAYAPGECISFYKSWKQTFSNSGGGSVLCSHHLHSPPLAVSSLRRTVHESHNAGQENPDGNRAHTAWFHLDHVQTRKTHSRSWSRGVASWEETPLCWNGLSPQLGAAAAVHTPVQRRELQA